MQYKGLDVKEKKQKVVDQDNVTEWSNISTHGRLCLCVSTKLI